jgi:hypothetical protein
MSTFNIKADNIIDYTLALQKINAVSLPIAVQNTLNSVARDVKKRTLNISTNKHFNIKKKSFFKANSGFTTFGAKQRGYKINNLVAYVGITKGKKANEKATTQVGNQQTAKRIKRSVNPLGDKPQSNANIKILSAKPVIYDSTQSYPEGNGIAFIRRAQKAKRSNTGFLIKGKNGKGAVNRVISVRTRKPDKRDPRKMIVNVKPIASYIPDGYVKLKTPHPFLIDAVIMSAKDIIESTFIKEAEKQFELALKRSK